MKKVYLAFGLALVMLLFAIVQCDSALATTPKLDFDEETCSVFVTPQGEPTPFHWFICINEEQYIAIVADEDRMDVLCDVSLQITPHEWLDVSEFVDCGTAVANDSPTWGTLKGMYR